VGVCLNLQPLPTNVLMGPVTQLIVGRSWLRENFAGFQLQIASDTFFQVFTAQAERVVPLLLQALGDPRWRLSLERGRGAQPQSWDVTWRVATERLEVDGMTALRSLPRRRA
jgi:hypothetical protein